MTSSNTDFWRGWSGDPAHPASPAGGGGPGKFTNAALMALWFSKKQRALSPLEKQDGTTGPKFPKEFRDTSLVTMD